MKNIYLTKLYCVRSLLCGCVIFILSGCDKDFLDAKPNKAILVPGALEHYQALLDNALNVMNRTPYLGEVGADDFYMAENTFESYWETEQNAYIWADRVYSALSDADWDLPHRQIFYANVVLDGLKEHKYDGVQAKNVKGAALFYRAWGLFQVAQLFGLPYNPENAATTRGLPVRLSADVTLPSEMGSLQDTYERMRADIEEAIPLLALEQPVSTRPTKAAGYGLLARLSLVMKEYGKAKQYADSTLALQNDLIDYNTLDAARAYAFPALYRNADRNPEVIFLSILCTNTYLGISANTLIEPSLYESYKDYDLRKLLFFDARRQFRGSYMGERFYQFSGLAVDEVYLVRAEANARTGDTEAACTDLNRLLVKRWKKDTYEPTTISDPQELLEVILMERRKELIGRGIRWGDLKRLNQEVRFEKVLKRNVNGKEYILLPNDSRYALPFPDSEGASK